MLRVQLLFARALISRFGWRETAHVSMPRGFGEGPILPGDLICLQGRDSRSPRMVLALTAPVGDSRVISW